MCWAKTTCDQGERDDRNHHQSSNYSIVYGWLPLPKTVIGAISSFNEKSFSFRMEAVVKAMMDTIVQNLTLY